LTDRHWRSLERDLRRSPREFGFAQTLWDGKLLAEHLRQRYQVCWECVNVSGCSARWDSGCANPGLSLPKADPAAQAAFKKTAPPGRRPGD